MPRFGDTPRVRRVLALLLCTLCGCDSSPPAWPSWPADDAAARALIEERAHRELDDEPPLTAGAIVSALDRAAARGTLRAGWRDIADSLRRHRVIVLGVHHDAREHVRVFSRLFGPSGTGDDRLWAIELFDAAGRWTNVQPADQAGDEEALDAFRQRGSSQALRTLRERLALGAYTAWKYDYLDDVLDVAVTARGAGRTLLGCDVPPALSARLEALDPDLRLRVREMHCALAIDDALRQRSSPRAALLWGDAHLAPNGIARFLADAPARVHVVGGRTSDAGLEPALAERLALFDPVLIPMGGQRFVLVVPDARLSARGDRSRVQLEAADPRPHLTASSTVPAELRVGGHRVELREEERTTTLDPGVRPFVVSAGEQRIAGSLPVEAGGFAELFVDPAGRRVDLRLASPARVPPGAL